MLITASSPIGPQLLLYIRQLYIHPFIHPLARFPGPALGGQERVSKPPIILEIISMVGGGGAGKPHDVCTRPPRKERYGNVVPRWFPTVELSFFFFGNDPGTTTFMVFAAVKGGQKTGARPSRSVDASERVSPVRSSFFVSVRERTRIPAKHTMP